MVKKPLTPKQRLFVAEYLKDKNATQAAIRAGYSEKTAYSIGQRLLKKVEIKAGVEAGFQKVEKKALVDAEFVIGGLRKVATRCMQEEQVVDREGNPTGEFKFDSSGANRSLELLGKHLNIFKESVDLNLKTFEQLKGQIDKYNNND